MCFHLLIEGLENKVEEHCQKAEQKDKEMESSNQKTEKRSTSKYCEFQKSSTENKGLNFSY